VMTVGVEEPVDRGRDGHGRMEQQRAGTGGAAIGEGEATADGSAGGFRHGRRGTMSDIGRVTNQVGPILFLKTHVQQGSRDAGSSPISGAQAHDELNSSL